MDTRKIISSNTLSIMDVPQRNSSWRVVSAFCLTFDTTEKVQKNLSIDSNYQRLSISDLRYILYVEQRRYNHFGKEPEIIIRQKIDDIIETIRTKLK